MKALKTLLCALLAGASFAAVNTQAAIVNSDAGFSLVEDFESFDGLVEKGPIGIAGGGVFESSVYSTLGASAVDLGDNGTWGAGNKFAGIGDLSFTPSTNEGFVGNMTFTLGGAPVRGVGANFSIFKDASTSGQVTIEALGAGGAVLETHDFIVNFNDINLTNASLFLGFVRGSHDIEALRVSGDGFVLDNLSVQPVPIPAAAFLMFPPLAGALGWARRNARRTA